MIALLAQNGADINTKNLLGQTCLWPVAQFSAANIPRSRAAIPKGAYDTTLSLAIAAGVDLTVRDNDNETVFVMHPAACANLAAYPEFRLLPSDLINSKGAYANANEKPPLLVHLSQNLSARYFQTVLEGRDDWDLLRPMNEGGVSIMAHFVRAQLQDVCAALCDYVVRVEDETAASALFAEIFARFDPITHFVSNSFANLLRFLAQSGRLKEINRQRPETGSTIFREAVLGNSVPLMEALVEIGAKIDSVLTPSGETLIMELAQATRFANDHQQTWTILAPALAANPDVILMKNAAGKTAMDIVCDWIGETTELVLRQCAGDKLFKALLPLLQKATDEQLRCFVEFFNGKKFVVVSAVCATGNVVLVERFAKAGALMSTANPKLVRFLFSPLSLLRFVSSVLVFFFGFLYLVFLVFSYFFCDFFFRVFRVFFFFFFC